MGLLAPTTSAWSPATARVNPNARVLVVVAEILLNRLLHPEAFDFAHVSAVVMDEFHSFADPERGIVWELSLDMLPPSTSGCCCCRRRSATRVEFVNWLDRVPRPQGRAGRGHASARCRSLPLGAGPVPQRAARGRWPKGDDATRKTPALVFCFNRDECWSVAEQLKGLDLLPRGAEGRAATTRCDKLDWPQGVGPKLKQMLRRGVGVHHAGLLPKYRRVVEDLFEKKLLASCVCTETLAAASTCRRARWC